MSKFQSPKFKAEESEPGDLPIIDGELMEDSPSINLNPSKIKDQKSKIEITDKGRRTKDEEPGRQSAIRHYLLLPVIFLTVTLLGGLRLSAASDAFIFLKPALICLVLAAILLILFFRAKLIRLDGWFSERFSTLKNTAHAFVLASLFTASVQMFNSLLPEKGLPFWIVALLFFWTLWNNLFSVFTPQRLLQSLGSLFGLAFVLKYLILANLTAPAQDNWLRALIENPAQEVFSYLLDLPKYSSGTGYIQFFTVILYVVGLFLLSPSADSKGELSSASSETIS